MVVIILIDVHGAIAGSIDGLAAAKGQGVLPAVPFVGFGNGPEGLVQHFFFNKNRLAVHTRAVLFKNFQGFIAVEDNASFFQKPQGMGVDELQLFLWRKIVGLFHDFLLIILRQQLFLPLAVLFYFLPVIF